MSMIEDSIRDMTIEDETFEEVRQNFNLVMQRLLKTMIDCEAEDGSIALKIDVSMANDVIPNYDPEIDSETREIHKPSFKHKVQFNVQVKDDVTGSKNPGMELVWDEDEMRYVLKPICNTEQRSIYDADFMEEDVEDATPALPERPGLPDNNDDPERYYKPM